MVDFIPLELWRASSLTSETKGVIAAYERCLAQGDFEALAALRAAIEVRAAALGSANALAAAVAPRRLAPAAWRRLAAPRRVPLARP